MGGWENGNERWNGGRAPRGMTYVDDRYVTFWKMFNIRFRTLKEVVFWILDWYARQTHAKREARSRRNNLRDQTILVSKSMRAAHDEWNSSRSLAHNFMLEHHRFNVLHTQPSTSSQQHMHRQPIAVTIHQDSFRATPKTDESFVSSTSIS